MTKQTQMYSTFDNYRVTDEERSELEVWAEHDGHCSACRADDVKVAHIGVREKAHVGICVECVSRMFLAVSTLPAAQEPGVENVNASKGDE